MYKHNVDNEEPCDLLFDSLAHNYSMLSIQITAGAFYSID